MPTLERIEILLAEDNPGDAEMTLRALRKCNLGDLVHWVKDGAEALEFLSCTGAYEERDPTWQLKLVLLDIKMPKVGGMEVLRHLRSDPRTCFLPVVIMTSSNEERDVMDSYRLGVNSYIVKPVEIGTFVDTVRTIGLYWVFANRAPG